MLDIKWNSPFNHFRMNTEEFTTFPDEQEVLLNDGCPFIVENVEKTNTTHRPTDNEEYYLITLRAPDCE